MTLEKVSEQVFQTFFNRELESRTRVYLKVLKMAVEKDSPVPRPEKYPIDMELEKLGWIKDVYTSTETFQGRHYEPTQQGIELYKQLVQEGYTFP